MKVQWKLPDGAQVRKLLNQYKYVLIAIVAGLILLLWPTGESREELPAAAGPAAVGETFDLAELEEKLAETLSQIEGAGKVTVTLTLKSGMEQVLASDRSTSVSERGSSVEEETVLISGGSGQGQNVVLLTQRWPTFQGALVVCEGGDDAAIRLLMTQAVSSLTGLGADRITVCRGNVQ